MLSIFTSDAHFLPSPYVHGRIRHTHTLIVMTHAKTLAFPLPQQHAARLAQALTPPARLAILHLLADRRRRLAGEICAALPLARTTVSQHLVALRKLGLLRAETKGLTVTYWLSSHGRTGAAGGRLFGGPSRVPALRTETWVRLPGVASQSVVI